MSKQVVEKERCPGTGTQYLPIYNHLPNGQEIKQFKCCPACGVPTLIDARRPWMPFHKRRVGQTTWPYWRKPAALKPAS